MGSTNPLHDLAQPWAVYKRSMRNIQRELHASYETPDKNVSGLRWAQARSWHHEARNAWGMACERVLGAPTQIEWVGDVNKPMCVVNGVMMFA